MDRNTSPHFISSMILTSLSARRAWIEILAYPDMIICTKSLSARRAWIEIASCWRVSGRALSLSARRAWIEISMLCSVAKCWAVALRKESVDRNQRIAKPFREQFKVALRKESVDRNSIVLASFRACITSLSARRAWIEMFLSMGLDGRFKLSLSARRAWIEIRIPVLLL